MKKNYHRHSKTATGVLINKNGAPVKELGHQPTQTKKPIKQKRKKWKK